MPHTSQGAIMSPVNQLLFIQGAGADSHDHWDNLLVDSLHRELGESYDIRYPRMPHEDDPHYAPWSAAISRELGALDDGAVVVGHSVGAAVLAATLAGDSLLPRLDSLVLIAAPFVGPGGWPGDEAALFKDLGTRLPAGLPVHLFHGTVDETVPHEHVDLYARAIPQARVHRLAARDHQLNNDLREVARAVTANRAGADPAGRREGSSTPDWLSHTRRSYDTDAPGYAEQVRGLLDRMPCLRASLAVFAESVLDLGGGPVADIGCGPGYVTRHLHDAGLDAFGIDLSREMIDIARRDHPQLRFEVGTMTDLDLADRCLSGIVAFWSTIHVPDRAMPRVCDQFHRVLRPGGPILLGFHVGDRIRHTDHGYTGRPVHLDSHHRAPSTVTRWLRDAGFTVEASLLIRPDSDTPGAIVFARAGS